MTSQDLRRLGKHKTTRHKTQPLAIGSSYANFKIISLHKDSNIQTYREYKVVCLECEKEYIRKHHGISKNRCRCQLTCSEETSARLSAGVASTKTNKANKSGYKGVSYYKRHESDYILGYQAIVMYQKRIILRNKISLKDTEGDAYKAILTCAIDRDLFIRGKDLPHFRNFTDEKLKELIKDDFYYQMKLSGSK